MRFFLICIQAQKLAVRQVIARWCSATPGALKNYTPTTSHVRLFSTEPTQQEEHISGDQEASGRVYRYLCTFFVAYRFFGSVIRTYITLVLPLPSPS